MARCGAVGSESSVKALSKSPGALRLERERPQPLLCSRRAQRRDFSRAKGKVGPAGARERWTVGCESVVKVGPDQGQAHIAWSKLFFTFTCIFFFFSSWVLFFALGGHDLLVPISVALGGHDLRLQFLIFKIGSSALYHFLPMQRPQDELGFTG